MAVIQHITPLAALLLICVLPLNAQRVELRVGALSSGAERSSGEGLMLRSTLGQVAVGRADGTSRVVSAGFWYQARGVSGVLVQNNAPSAPRITEPADGAVFTVGGEPGEAPEDPASTISLVWVGGEDPDGDRVTYYWQLAEDDGFTSLLFSQELGTGSEFEATLALLAHILSGAELELGESITLWHRVAATDGTAATVGPAIRITFTRGTLVSAPDEAIDLPRSFELHQNYPNPFNPTTTLAYDLPERTRVRLIVYDVFGRELSTLIDRTQSPGRYTVTFEADRLASGVYLYRIEAGSFEMVRRMLLVK